jgi:hypothetical protein
MYKALTHCSVLCDGRKSNSTTATVARAKPMNKAIKGR